MDGLSEEEVVYRGKLRIVAWARSSNGSRPAQEFLEGEAQQYPEYRARLWRCFTVMGDHGFVRNKQAFRHEDGPVYGFKAWQLRVGAFQDGRIWYLTHGFMKKQSKWPPEEIRRARRIMVEHLGQKGVAG